MEYYVIHPNGERFGPADTDTIRRWLDDKRVRLDWLVAEKDSGKQMVMSSILPPAAYEPDPIPTTPQSAPPYSSGFIGSQPSEFTSPGIAPPLTQSPYPRVQHGADVVDGQGWHTASIVISGFAIAANFILCYYLAIPLGIAGIVCGAVAKKRSKLYGTAGIIMGVISIIIAIIFLVFLRDILLNYFEKTFDVKTG